MPEEALPSQDNQLDGLSSRSAAIQEGASRGFQMSAVEDDEALQFIELVRQAIVESLDRATEPLSDQPAVFVRIARPRERAAEFGAEQLKDLNRNSPNAWLGKIVLTAAHGRGGFAAPLPSNADGVIHQLATSELREEPLIVFHPSPRRLVCRPKGAADPSVLEFTLPQSGRPLTLDDLLAAIDEYHLESLLSPAVCPPTLWTKPGEYQSGKHPEKQVQWGLELVLRSTFRPIKVEAEQNSPVGRVDLLMTDPRINRPGALHPATIEVKAVRSKRSGGATISTSEMITHVAEGHSQAAAYRVRYAAPIGLLACFDMRESKTDILNETEVMQARATYFTPEMHARIYPMFGTAHEAQQYVALSAASAQNDNP